MVEVATTTTPERVGTGTENSRALPGKNATNPLAKAPDHAKMGTSNAS
jgi:hypothetical protein